MAIIAEIIEGKSSVTVYGLWQYDYGQQLEIRGLSGLPAVTPVHFAIEDAESAEIRTGAFADGILTCAIPDAVLRQASPVWAYVYIDNGTAGQTVKAVRLCITPRAEPTEAVTPEQVDAYGELVAQLNGLIAEVEQTNNEATAQADRAEDEADRAEGEADDAELAKSAAVGLYNNFTADIGTKVCPLVGGQVPAPMVPQTIVLAFVNITDESDLTDLTLEQVQPNDVARVLETGEDGNPICTAQYQLVGPDPAIRSNWAILNTNYAANAGFAAQAGNAYNASKINGILIVDMPQAEYDALLAAGATDPNTYYYTY